MSRRIKVKSPMKLTIAIIILVIIVSLIAVLMKSNEQNSTEVSTEVSKSDTSQTEVNESNTIIENVITNENSINNETNTQQENNSIENNITNNTTTENNTTKDNATTNNTTKNTTTNQTTNNTTLQNTTKNSTTTKSSTTDNRTKTTNPKYYIKVNIEQNVVTIYEKDVDGEYTVPVKAILCSTGRATPEAGEIFTMPADKWNRYPWGTMVGGVYAQYYSRINGNILFHSVPYTKEKKNALEYEEYDKLGTRASAGCIRMTVINAKWIYDNCPPGTKVEFYASSDPGPLGKPTEQKISDADENLRCWDPTDPDKNNPWNK